MPVPSAASVSDRTFWHDPPNGRMPSGGTGSTVGVGVLVGAGAGVGVTLGVGVEVGDETGPASCWVPSILRVFACGEQSLCMAEEPGLMTVEQRTQRGLVSSPHPDP